MATLRNGAPWLNPPGFMTIGDYYIDGPASPGDPVITVDADASGDGLMRYHRPPVSSSDIRMLIEMAFNNDGGAIEEYAVVDNDPVYTLVAWEHNCDHSDCELDCEHNCNCEQLAIDAHTKATQEIN